jgi:hypothetical protein
MGSSFLVDREFEENDDRERHRSTARGTRMVRSAMSRHIAACARTGAESLQLVFAVHA